jgi:hypothetical protein
VGEYLCGRNHMIVQCIIHTRILEYPDQGYKRVTTANHVSQLEIAAQVHTSMHAYCTCIQQRISYSIYSVSASQEGHTGPHRAINTGHTDRAYRALTLSHHHPPYKTQIHPVAVL